MFDGLLLVMVFTAHYLGFAFLALTQRRHWHRVTGAANIGAKEPGTGLRRLGYSFLAASLAAALSRDGPGFGSLLWVVSLSAGAVAVSQTLAWRPRWLRPLARGAREL